MPPDPYTGEIVAIVLSTTLLPAISFCIYCLYRCWRSKQEEDEEVPLTSTDRPAQITTWNVREFKIKNSFGVSHFEILDMKDEPVLNVSGTWECWKINDLNTKPLATITQHQHLMKYHYFDIQLDQFNFTLKMHRLPQIYYTANNMYISGNFQEFKYVISQDDQNGVILGKVSPIRFSSAYVVNVSPQADPLIILTTVLAVHGSIIAEKN